MTTTADRFGDDFGGEKMWGLKELPYPESIAMTPQTMGWVVVGLVLLAALLWIALRAYRNWQKDAYRRQARQQIDGMLSQSVDARALPFLIRKTALAAFDRREVASLRGADWIDWLNSRLPSARFEADDAGLLDRLAYSDAGLPEEQVNRLLKTARHWMVHHRA